MFYKHSLSKERLGVSDEEVRRGHGVLVECEVYGRIFQRSPYPSYLIAPTLCWESRKQRWDREPGPVPELSKSTLQTQFACPSSAQSLF